MYFHPRYTVSVRDGQAHYHAPNPPDPFPAARVLDDLRRAPGAETPHIVARYTALRCWTLTAAGAESAVVEHARSAAREHLAAVPGPWPEGALLERLLDARRSGLAAALLEEAAAEAAAKGHGAGSLSLLHAAARALAGRVSGSPSIP